VFVVAGSESLIVDTHDNQLVPEHGRIGLNQNYPNPFNPATTIEFWLSSRNYAEISVYNSIGEVITTLVHSVLPAGAHHVEWNGTDRYGHPVASGLYFYQLNAGGVQEAKKLIVIR